MNRVDHTRHIGIFNADGWAATLIGAGGIGSMTGIVLAKMGLSQITLYDDDNVDEVNIATQFYRFEDIGQPKVSALKTLIERFSDTLVTPSTERVTLSTNPDELRNPIIISAVDSVDARKEIWDAVQKANPLWYLDARMAAEQFHLYTVDMDEPGWYDASLMALNEDDVPELPCTEKATIYTAAVAAGHIAATVKNIIIGGPTPHLITHHIPNYVLLQP
jgi:molybdopterin/thiamine biosynthesis adenylyltransferase